jgi:GTP-binding nuclear protein Ran
MSKNSKSHSRSDGAGKSDECPQRGAMGGGGRNFSFTAPTVYYHSQVQVQDPNSFPVSTSFSLSSSNIVEDGDDTTEENIKIYREVIAKSAPFQFNTPLSPISFASTTPKSNEANVDISPLTPAKEEFRLRFGSPSEKFLRQRSYSRKVMQTFPIVQDVKSNAPPFWTEPIKLKVIIAGDFRVGKTTWIKRLRTRRFEKSYNPTLGVDVNEFTIQSNRGPLTFNCWDTAGQERYGGLRDGYYIKAQAAIIMHGATSSTSLSHVPNWHRDLTRVTDDIPIVCVGNLNCSPTNYAWYYDRLQTHCQQKNMLHVEMNIEKCDAVDLLQPFLQLARELVSDENLQFIISQQQSMQDLMSQGKWFEAIEYTKNMKLMELRSFLSTPGSDLKTNYCNNVNYCVTENKLLSQSIVEYGDGFYHQYPCIQPPRHEMYASLPDSVWEVPVTAEKLSVGITCRTKYGYPDDEFEYVTIQKVNDDETFDIVYCTDDDTQKNVPLNEIQIQSVSLDLLFYTFLFHVLYTLLCFAHNLLLSFYLLSFSSFPFCDDHTTV